MLFEHDLCYLDNEKNLKIITAISDVFEKSIIISSAIFLALPYGFMGT